MPWFSLVLVADLGLEFGKSQCAVERREKME